MYVLLSIVGLVLILLGANYLTDGAVALAQKLKVPEIVIGLTIVAIGTSMPELVVSVISSINGQYDLSVGNVVGSNLFNILVILGIVALIKPVALTKGNIMRDLPMCLLSSVVLWAACSTNVLDGTNINIVSRSNGVIMLALFVGFLYMTITASRSEVVPAEKEEQESSKPLPLWLALIMLLGGFAGLIYGGELFIDNITEIARALSVSESVISITIVAAGTSMPELATSVVAMIKGRKGIALGNVVGSNISNVFLVLGASSVIHPLTLTGINQIDLMMVLLSTILMLMAAWTFGRKRIDRVEGGFFVACYIAYMIWLLQ
ncbi:MAG: calcium/sodium antiporter [Rikenellaceae bacterium]|nr:calcium/sodium antiporter [Rikenellaceae bacterium]